MSEIDDKVLEKLELGLNSIIRKSLYGPSGDPDWSHHSSAAECFHLLKTLKLKVYDEENIRQMLEEENIHETNFLKHYK